MWAWIGRALPRSCTRIRNRNLIIGLGGMPFYHLHIQEGPDLIEDETGMEFPDLKAAREEALEGARDLWASAMKSTDGRDHLDSAIVIADEHGHELRRVNLIDVLPPRLRDKLGHRARQRARRWRRPIPAYCR